MALLITARERLQQARSLASVLDAACDAFEDILAVIGKYEETTTSTGMAMAFLLVATQAANGRDAVLFAPSLPPRGLRPRQAPGRPEQAGAGDIRDAVASLSLLLASRLADTAATAEADGDRAACYDAACSPAKPRICWLWRTRDRARQVRRVPGRRAPQPGPPGW
jgi:hypothetical protein